MWCWLGRESRPFVLRRRKSEIVFFSRLVDRRAGVFSVWLSTLMYVFDGIEYVGVNLRRNLDVNIGRRSASRGNRGSCSLTGLANRRLF